MGTNISSLVSGRNLPLWMWKAGDTPWEENTDWKPYLDIENHILEQGFQENKSTVELDGYYCDLEKYIQMNKKDPNKQRPIKRISSVDINKRFRSKQRYILQKPELKPELAALGWTSAWSRFLLAAGVFSVIKNEELTERVEKAADGILEEGIKHDKQIEGKWIANELRKVKDEDRTIIGLCCVKLFTIESFLYPLLNEVLRESEVQNTGMECVHEFTTELGKSQGRTLGPFCSLLWFYLYENPSQRLTYIYRTASLTEKNINDYEKHKGEWMVWIDFSIATKSKTNALNSQENTIYEIKVRDGGVPGVIDVSTLSGYPSENEVLIIAGIPYEIKAINYDDQLKKYFIHIEL